MKKSFLVVYNYGMGGVWAVVEAHAESEILQKYPMVTVIHTRPASMTDEDYGRIASELTVDIDDPPKGWLSAALTEATRS